VAEGTSVGATVADAGTAVGVSVSRGRLVPVAVGTGEGAGGDTAVLVGVAEGVAVIATAVADASGAVSWVAVDDGVAVLMAMACATWMARACRPRAAVWRCIRDAGLLCAAPPHARVSALAAPEASAVADTGAALPTVLPVLAMLWLPTVPANVMPRAGAGPPTTCTIIEPRISHRQGPKPERCMVRLASSVVWDTRPSQIECHGGRQTRVA
jgi:hypothetical protein